MRTRILAVYVVCVRKKGIDETATDLMQFERWAHDWLKRYDERGFDGLWDLSRSSRFMQTRLEQLTVEKHKTVSADLTRQYGTHLEKTRKSLLAVARLPAGRSSRASLQANSQTPSSPPPYVDADDTGAVAASSRRRRRCDVTSTGLAGADYRTIPCLQHVVSV